MNSLKFFSTLEKNIILEKKYYFNKKRERFTHNVFHYIYGGPRPLKLCNSLLKFL